MSTLLEQAVTYIKAGNIEKGKELLVQVLKQNPRDENAWLWMSRCVTSPSQKRDCFQRVLQLNSNNKFAQEGLRRLESVQSNQTIKPEKNPSLTAVGWLIIGIFACVCVMLPLLSGIALNSSSSPTPVPTTVPVVLDAISLMGKSLDEIRSMYTVIDPLYELPLIEPDRDIADIDYGEEYTTGKHKFTVFYNENYLVNQVDLTVLRYTSPELEIIGESYEMSEWIAVMQMLNLPITSPPDKVGGVGDIPSNYTWHNYNGYMIWMNGLTGKNVIFYSKVIKLK